MLRGVEIQKILSVSRDDNFTAGRSNAGFGTSKSFLVSFLSHNTKVSWKSWFSLKVICIVRERSSQKTGSILKFKRVSIYASKNKLYLKRS